MTNVRSRCAAAVAAPRRRGLEFHHREPYGRGGAHDPDNVCLICRQHNAYVAELEYGTERMEKYRRRGDRVSEAAPEYTERLQLGRIADQGPLLRLLRATSV